MADGRSNWSSDNSWVSLNFRYSFDKSFRITDVTMLTLTYGHYLPTKDC